MTKHSTLGVISKYAGSAVTWMSIKEKIYSTTEAKFIATSERTEEAIWLTRIVNEIWKLNSTLFLYILTMQTLYDIGENS